MAQAFRYSPQRSALTFRPTSMLATVSQTRGPAAPPGSAPGTPAPAATPQVRDAAPSVGLDGNAMLRAAGDGGGSPGVSRGRQMSPRARFAADLTQQPMVDAMTNTARASLAIGAVNTGAALAVGAPARFAAQLGLRAGLTSLVHPFSALPTLANYAIPAATSSSGALSALDDANVSDAALDAYNQDAYRGDDATVDGVRAGEFGRATDQAMGYDIDAGFYGHTGAPTTSAMRPGTREIEERSAIARTRDAYGNPQPLSSQALGYVGAIGRDAVSAVTGSGGSMSHFGAIGAKRDAVADDEYEKDYGTPEMRQRALSPVVDMPQRAMGPSGAGRPTAPGYNVDKAQTINGRLSFDGVPDGRISPDITTGADDPGNEGASGYGGHADNDAQNAAASAASTAGQQADAQAAENDAQGAGGNDSDGTVLCTELYRQGIMPEHIYRADQAYGRTLPAEVVEGYHLWAVPLAAQMRKRRRVTWIMRPLVMAWARMMAQKMGATSDGSRLGAVIEAVGVPVCGALGFAARVAKTVRASFVAQARFAHRASRR